MTKIAAPLVSALARFVQGDIKGGAHAHAFRQETIRTAIEQMFKGNYSPITESAALTKGKAKKARAYHAGFATFGVIGTDTKKVDYVGALASPANTHARDQIDSLTKVAFGQFFAAFDAVMSEKAAPKAKEAPSPVTDVTPAPVVDTVDSDTPTVAEIPAASVDLDDLVLTITNAANMGMLGDEHLTMLGDAIRAAEARALLALPELQAA